MNILTKDRGEESVPTFYLQKSILKAVSCDYTFADEKKI
jgi:hypothetical protein